MIVWCFLLACALTACNVSDDTALNPNKKPNVTDEDTGVDADASTDVDTSTGEDANTGADADAKAHADADANLPGDDVATWQPDAACSELEPQARCEAPLGADGVAANWGACESLDSDDVCGTDGIERRIMQVGTCSESGQCVFTETEESAEITRSCERVTDDLPCGDPEESNLTACTNAVICATTGTQKVTITSYTCGSGVCNSGSETITRACARQTEGDTCQNTLTTAPGPCTRANINSCSSAGKRVHTVTTFSCDDSATCQGDEEAVEEQCTLAAGANNNLDCQTSTITDGYCFETCCIPKCPSGQVCQQPTCIVS
ncbi:MAG: hypothetical protein H0U74_16905 [Bradymonadaceae bacterium]|nr:hypothetical protein [Lujinxingiaceae bacterium]